MKHQKPPIDPMRVVVWLPFFALALAIFFGGIGWLAWWLL